MSIKHTDSAGVDAAAADTLTFSAKFHLRENLNFALASFVSDAADELFLFRSDEGVHNGSNYEFKISSVAAADGNLVYVSMFLQVLGVK